MPKDEQFEKHYHSNEVPGYDLEKIPSSITKEAWSLEEYEGFIDKLISILGKENVSRDEDARRFYAEDTFRSFETPIVAVSPESLDQISKTTKLCSDFGIAIVPRGGGMSYTDGYLHTRKKSITVDKAISVRNRTSHHP